MTQHDPCCASDATTEAATVTDPVCGMQVDPETSEHQAEHDGETFHFCSAGCKTKFENDPQRYLDGSGSEEETPAKPGTIYTCPMHPEVRQVGPGS